MSSLSRLASKPISAARLRVEVLASQNRGAEHRWDLVTNYNSFPWEMFHPFCAVFVAVQNCCRKSTIQKPSPAEKVDCVARRMRRTFLYCTRRLSSSTTTWSPFSAGEGFLKSTLLSIKYCTIKSSLPIKRVTSHRQAIGNRLWIPRRHKCLALLLARFARPAKVRLRAPRFAQDDMLTVVKHEQTWSTSNDRHLRRDMKRGVLFQAPLFSYAIIRQFSGNSDSSMMKSLILR